MVKSKLPARPLRINFLGGLVVSVHAIFVDLGYPHVYNRLMSLCLEAVRAKPQCLFMMDDTTPLQDYSGYARTGAITGGTPTHAPALVKGAAWSPVLTGTVKAEFTSPVFVQGKEKQPFSLIATVFPIKVTTDSAQQILSHSGQYDGLSINGTVVSFSTKYLSTGEAKCSHDLQVVRAINIVATHNESKNALYIDGVLVSEVDITPEQQSDSYVATDGKLYSGNTTTSNKIAVNGVGVYSYVLPQDIIANMHKTARDVPDGLDVASIFGGERIAMSRELSDIFVDQWWQTSADWKTAELRGVGVVDDKLVPLFSEGVSLPGEWLDSFVLSTTGLTSIYGVNFDWSGSGAVVEASLDGVTWTAAQRGVNISIIPAGFDPTDTELLIRVSFPGGIADDPSYLDNLNIVGLRTGTSPVSSRPLTMTSSYQQRSYPVIEMRDNWGAQIASGGNITIGADTTDAASFPRTIEVWIKRMNSTSPTLNVSGTNYQNGVANAGTLPIGEWTLLDVVLSSNYTGDLVITGPAQIGQVVYYGTALSAGQIADKAAVYASNTALRVIDTATISVTQVAEAASIYAHDWSIQAAG
jgi:hypothetical protein